VRGVVRCGGSPWSANLCLRPETSLVVELGVAQAEHCVNHAPGEDHAGDTEADEQSLGQTAAVSRADEHKADREKACETRTQQQATRLRATRVLPSRVRGRLRRIKR